MIRPLEPRFASFSLAVVLRALTRRSRDLRPALGEAPEGQRPRGRLRPACPLAAWPSRPSTSGVLVPLGDEEAAAAKVKGTTRFSESRPQPPANAPGPYFVKGEHRVSFTAGETCTSRGLWAGRKPGQAAEVHGRAMPFADELSAPSLGGELGV